MQASLILGQIAVGLAAGGGYAVVAVGLSYTLGLARVMNFAFGTFYMLTAFVTAFLISQLGLAYLLAGVLGIAAILVVGTIFGFGIVLPAMRISDSSVMIATLGVAVILTNLAQYVFGAEVSFIATPLTDIHLRLAGASVNLQAVLCMIMAPVLTLALSSFMDFTVTGKRIRATAESPSLASATGLNVPMIQVLAVVIGILLAGAAAVLYAPVGVISVFMGDEVLLKAFAITALAGIGRIWGALGLAFVIGIFEALVGAFISTSYSTAAIYALLVVVFIFFPRGLFHGH
jgi:branched-chain amino acid transport system permease protein